MKVTVEKTEEGETPVEMKQESVDDIPEDISPLVHDEDENKEHDQVEQLISNKPLHDNTLHDELSTPQVKTSDVLYKEEPYFTKNLVDITVMKGQSSCMECLVKGSPKPDVKWFIDGEEVESGSVYVPVEAGDGVHMLLIKETLSEDEGEYLCEATNELGSAHSAAMLTVKGNGVKIYV